MADINPKDIGSADELKRSFERLGQPINQIINSIGNMFDEAEKIGMKINIGQLERDLKIPVAATVSTTGKGVDVLRGKIEAYVGTKK